MFDLTGKRILREKKTAEKMTAIYCKANHKIDSGLCSECKDLLNYVQKRLEHCFFVVAEEARSAGFRPCKRCRSDLLDYQPIREIAEKAKRLLDDSFRKSCELNQKLRQLGVSSRRMVDIFQEEYGLTLSEYVGKLRLAEAKRLLSDTDGGIIDIAYSVGFGGLSSFYRFFLNGVGVSPAAYREETLN